MRPMSRSRSNKAWIVIGLLIFVGSRCRDNSAPPTDRAHG